MIILLEESKREVDVVKFEIFCPIFSMIHSTKEKLSGSVLLYPSPTRIYDRVYERFLNYDELREFVYNAHFVEIY